MMLKMFLGLMILPKFQDADILHSMKTILLFVIYLTQMYTES